MKKNVDQSSSASFFNVWRDLKAAQTEKENNSPVVPEEPIEKQVVASQPLQPLELDTTESDLQA